jgi:hypothetical protein
MLWCSSQAKVPIWVFVFCVLASPSGATPPVPDERDARVLETLLLHLLHDPKFEMTRVPTNEWVIAPVIVLYSRTPEKTGFLQAQQLHSDTGEHTLPRWAEQDLRRRNSPVNAKPDSYDCVTAYYTNLTFHSRIVMTDLSNVSSNRQSFRGLQDAYPNARGFVRAYLPGYSKDGNQALVRAAVAPSVHGAMITALLEKSGEKWIVKWYHIAQYA